MYRGTTSDIVYIQQLGRALSSGSNHSCIVFDIVDNLHRKAVFDITDSPAEPAGLEGDIHYDGGDAFPSTSNISPNKGTGGSVDVGGHITGGDEPWWRGANRISREDVIVTGNEATYKELIAKAVAEPMLQRCMEAFEAHFRRWCINNNIPYPISDSDLESLYNLSKDDFVAYFKNTIETKGIEYPMGDAARLLQIGKKRDDGIPLEIFAKWKNVSIKSILDTLGVA